MSATTGTWTNGIASLYMGAREIGTIRAIPGGYVASLDAGPSTVVYHESRTRAVKRALAWATFAARHTA